MRLSARSWDRVPRMTMLWWSSRPRALFVDLLKYQRLLFVFGAFVAISMCFCLLRVRAAPGPSSLLKLEGCPQPLGTRSRG